MTRQKRNWELNYLKVVTIPSTNCASGNCTTTFTELVNDGFYDADFVDENVLGRLEISSYKPDGLVPNLERFGGKPYMYIPSTFKINPGY